MNDPITVKAIYKGVKNYGSEDVTMDNVECFQYRFLIEGEETLLRIDPGERNADGSYEYPIQNCLKEQRVFEITIKNDTVVSASELPTEEEFDFQAAVSGTPGERSLGNFLKTAMEPVGTTLYIYGGGWNWQDLGASNQARTLKVSPEWVKFFRRQDENFTYKSKDGDESKANPAASYYPYGGYNEYNYLGLDCSGYLGWAIYNTLETQSGKKGYVIRATRMAKTLSEMGLGDWTQELAASSGGSGVLVKPGDIVSISGHVWLSLGTCSDGSVVILHSTPAFSRTGQPGGGVELSAIGLSMDCEAYRLADRYMAEYYPEWYRRYLVKLADPELYFSCSGDSVGRFTWHIGADGLSDPEHISDMKPAQVLAFLVGQGDGSK